MMRMMLRLVVPLMAVLALTVAACGRGDDEGNEGAAFRDFAVESVATEERGFAVGAPAPAMAPALSFAPQALPAPRPEPAAAAAVAVTDFGEEGSDTVAQLATQERIIVRTANMALVVLELQPSIDAISSMATEAGGWVVSTNRSQKNFGFISIRVPADQLNPTIMRLRELADDVRFENIDSRDVTDEYTDLRARLVNQQAAEAALVRLLDRAETVEDALEVQKSLSSVREKVERLQGRIKLLEETSAFSLVSVNLELKPVEMPVDEILTKTAGVGELVRFRAFFTPPEDIDEFRYTWEFGDGGRVDGHQTIKAPEEGKRVTAVVTHVYRDERDSPFIVQFDITGSGDAGAAEGEQTLSVNVTRVPEIVVFAGGSIVAEEGEEIEFSGSFTRPEGIGDVTFKWDFGDGTAPENGTVEAGTTNAVATHTYKDHRPFPYTATLEITSESDAGEVSGKGLVNVVVTKGEGWVLAGWSANDQGKTAVRALSGVGQVSVSVLIWAAILSPAWAPIGGLLFWSGRKLVRRRRARSTTSEAA